MIPSRWFAFRIGFALLAAAGACVWFGDARAGGDAERSPDSALRIARLAALCELTTTHFDMCVTNPKEGVLQRELVEGLRAESNLGVNWTSRYFPTPVDGVAQKDQPPNPNRFEERAMAQLRQQKTKSREILSDDGTHYVRAIRLDKNCSQCHGRGTDEPDGKEGQAMGFLSLDLSFDDLHVLHGEKPR